MAILAEKFATDYSWYMDTILTLIRIAGDYVSEEVCTGFVQILENLEAPGILLWHFPGLESPGKRLLVLESSGNLLNWSKRYEVYGRW